MNKPETFWDLEWSEQLRILIYLARSEVYHESGFDPGNIGAALIIAFCLFYFGALLFFILKAIFNNS